MARKKVFEDTIESIVDRLTAMEIEKQKLNEKEKELNKRLHELEAEALRKDLDFDNGRLIGLFKDEVEVRLCTKTGEDIQQEKGKRIRLTIRIPLKTIKTVL